ncbi:MAG: alpha/beta hydrolase [Candidatus Methylarchaceae archaeon HK01M]|nr:alpha/beta hydrolase [Candidatus Methylarchaceae archaeon HK01M]
MVRVPKIIVNNIDINYQEEGAGFPLILIHGLSDDSTLWAPLMPKFSRHYWSIALDVRGHGHSGKPDMPYSIQLFSEDLLGFFEKLEIPQAHLLGLSMGGAIAQQFALDHPEKIRSIILLSAFSYNDSNLQNIFKRLQKSFERDGFSVFFDEVVKLVVSPEFASANADAIAEMKGKSIKINSPTAILHAIDACLDFNVKDRISQISHPTLIISGKEDILTPPQLGEQIHRSIKGSEWKIIEGVGHNLLIPEKIQELAQIILKFLGRH